MNTVLETDFAPPSEKTWLPHMVTIEDIYPETMGVVTYSLKFKDDTVGETYQFLPGQFNMLYLPGIGEAAISISSDAEKPQPLLHTVRAAGNVTQALARKKVGDRLALRGPFGSSWPVERAKGQDVILAAGGIGLAPLRPVVYHLIRHRADYGRVILLNGARTSNDLLYAGEYDDWRKADIEVEVTVDIGDSDWQGHIGVVPTLFYRLRLHAHRTHVFTCGPEIMIHFVIFEALARRVAPGNIYLSMERNMNCAVGLCGHCQYGPNFVCKDGPVFTYEQIRSFQHVEDF